jgi:putative serine/threonine protein kinase
LRYDVVCKLGEGNRGEVYKIRLENGKFAALKFSKNYDIQKEWDILKYLNGRHAPKPLFKSKKYLVMELIEGETLKDAVNTKKYYLILKEALKAAYRLDELGVFHKQLGRYYHIFWNENGIKFIDFERAVFSEKPRNFLQILGYYLMRDDKFDEKELKKIGELYKKEPLKALFKIERALNGIIKELNF